jgi:hypothetical protein
MASRQKIGSHSLLAPRIEILVRLIAAYKIRSDAPHPPCQRSNFDRLPSATARSDHRARQITCIPVDGADKVLCRGGEARPYTAYWSTYASDPGRRRMQLLAMTRVRWLCPFRAATRTTLPDWQGRCRRRARAVALALCMARDSRYRESVILLTPVSLRMA